MPSKPYIIWSSSWKILRFLKVRRLVEGSSTKIRAIARFKNQSLSRQAFCSRHPPPWKHAHWDSIVCPWSVCVQSPWARVARNSSCFGIWVDFKAQRASLSHQGHSPSSWGSMCWSMWETGYLVNHWNVRFLYLDFLLVHCCMHCCRLTVSPPEQCPWTTASLTTQLQQLKNWPSAEPAQDLVLACICTMRTEHCITSHSLRAIL